MRVATRFLLVRDILEIVAALEDEAVAQPGSSTPKRYQPFVLALLIEVHSRTRPYLGMTIRINRI